jgi:hypothetical protein
VWREIVKNGEIEVFFVSGIGLLVTKVNSDNCDTNKCINPEEETESNVMPKTPDNKTNYNTIHHTTLQQNEEEGLAEKQQYKYLRLNSSIRNKK